MLGGGFTPVGPPPVPSVTFHAKPSRRKLPQTNRPRCGHCLMVEHAAQKGARADVPPQFLPLEATHVITQIDGSTLTLCAQHVREHEERGKCHE